MTQVEEEGMLARWSRRKQQSTLESELDDPGLDLPTPELDDQETNQPVAVESEPGAESEEEPVLTDADMPPIDTLTEKSDFSGFMSSGVSDELRNLALRKLFSAPSFNIRDGLDEYDEDYTYFEKLGDIVTCDMKHQIEMEEAEKEAAAKEDAEREAAKVEQQTADELAAESVDESAPIDEAADGQGESESKIEVGEEDISESDSPALDSDLEPSEPIKSNSSESTEETS